MVFLEFLLLSSCVLITGKTINVQEVYRNNGAHISQKEPIKGALEETPNIDEQNIAGVKFLVAVNDTWGSCIATVRTPMLKPKIPANETERILVGKCDSGPLTYTVGDRKGGNVTIDLTFYSSVIEDASPPTCSIPFTGGFLPPTTLRYEDGGYPSVLPGCSTMDSREGYHMTYYWFYIYDVLVA